MRCIYWNLRGIANSPTKLALERLLSIYKPEFCFIAEPWMSLGNFPIRWFTRKHLKVFAVNDRPNMLPNLWCICSIDLDPEIISIDDQQVSFTLKVNEKSIGMSVVYASTNYVKRRTLWQSLTNVHNSLNSPWSCIGDFNTILGSHEYRGAHSPAKLPMADFAYWSDNLNLLHLPITGCPFTWSNEREGVHHTEKMLDRVICNHSWVDLCSNISCSTLTKIKSDHFPILFDFQMNNIRYASNFKFLKMWSHHNDCSNLIKLVWSKRTFGSPM